MSRRRRVHNLRQKDRRVETNEICHTAVDLLYLGMRQDREDSYYFLCPEIGVK